MTIEVVTLISIASVCFSILFGLKNSKRADNSDVELRAREQATVNAKLDAIGLDCHEIKHEVGTVKRDVAALSERLVIVEQSVKSAHHRIDELNHKGSRDDAD